MERLTDQESWISKLESPELNDEAARARAAATLGASTVNALLIRRGVPALRRASADSDPIVRARAIGSLQTIEAAWTSSPRLREAVIKEFSLGHVVLHRDGVMFFEEHDVACLRDALADADLGVRRSAADSLKRCHRSGLSDHTEDVIVWLARAVSDADERVRKESADALYNVADGIQEVQRRSNHRPRTLVHWAKMCAFGWGVEQFRRVAVPALEQASTGASEAVRAAARDALAQAPALGPERRELVPTIVRAFQEERAGLFQYDPPDAVVAVLDCCDRAELAELAATLAGYVASGDTDFRNRVRQALAMIESAANS